MWVTVNHHLYEKYFKMKLTLEQLVCRASNHVTRSQFRKYDSAGFKSAKRQGLLNALYPNPRTSPSKLTDEQIIQSAKLCSTRVEFKCRFDARWRAAHERGLMDILFPPKPPTPPKPPKPEREEWEKVQKQKTNRKITHELVREVASQCRSRSDLANIDPVCANFARKYGMMDELFPGPYQYATQTTEGFVAKAKEVHGDRFDYSEVNYNRTLEKVKIICPKHGSFWQRPASHLGGRGCAKCWSFDNDAFYMKRAKDHYFNGNPVFKVGVTSIRLGDARLKQQSLASKIKHEVVIQPTRIIGAATNIERYALSLGANPQYVGFDGCSEYRAYSEEDVLKIKEMVELCCI